MSVTLTASGTAGTKAAAITVGGATGLITVMAGRWTGGFGVQTWGTLGTIASPGGVLSVTLPAYGFYFIIAKTATGEVSNPATLPVYNVNVDFLNACQEGIAATLKRMNIPKIEDRVFTQMTPQDTVVTYPCAIVVWQDGTDNMVETMDAGGMNETALIGHPFRVLLCDRGNQNQQELRAKLALWRQSVWSAFDMQRLVDVPKVSYCKAEFGKRIQAYSFNADGQSGNAIQMLATILTIRCFVRQLRGIGQ